MTTIFIFLFICFLFLLFVLIARDASKGS